MRLAGTTPGCALLSMLAQPCLTQPGTYAGLFGQEYRPDADELLQMPILAQHEACQQETMCKWLTQVGDPRACNDEGDEPVFKNWNHNPKIPLLTPRAADCGKPEPSPSTSISTGDAGRVPDDEASRGDEGSDRKRAKTTTECTSRSSV